MKINKQNDIKDCGLEVIRSLHDYFFQNEININELKRKADYGENGINIINLIKLAKKYGILLEAYEISFENIILQKKKFFIGLIENQGMNHYVIFKVKNNKILVWDSLEGKYKLTLNEFQKIFKNVVFTIEKSSFNLQKIVTSKPFNYLFKNYNILIFITFSILISLLFMFIFSLFTKIVIDKIVPQKLEKTLFILTVSFIFLSLLRVFNNFVKSFVLRKLELRISYDINFLYLQKLNNCNLSDINKITATDNLRRIGLIEPISKFISSCFFNVFHETILFIFSFSMLMFISIKLFSIALFSGCFIFMLSFAFNYVLAKNYDDLLSENLNLFSNFVDLTKMVNKLKDQSVSSFLNNKFKNDYFKLKKREWKIWSYTNFQNFIESLFSYIIPILIIYFGSKLIFNNDLTIGSLLFFVSVYSYFLGPIESFSSFLIEFPIYKKNINLINYVLFLEEEKLNLDGIKIAKINQLEFNNVFFGYDKNILKIDDLKINTNLIIEGKNGSGKSTFLKNIKFLSNFKGEIKINNFDHNLIAKNTYRDNVIYISSNEYFPNITIFEYITNLDKNAIKTFQKNLINLKLNDILKNLNINLNLKMENNAANLSSGQKQVVSILKIFTKKYFLILLDEAFENVDKNNLTLIIAKINKFQSCLKIEISHSKKYLTSGKRLNIEKFN